MADANGSGGFSGSSSGGSDSESDTPVRPKSPPRKKLRTVIDRSNRGFARKEGPAPFELMDGESSGSSSYSSDADISDASTTRSRSPPRKKLCTKINGGFARWQRPAPVALMYSKQQRAPVKSSLKSRQERWAATSAKHNSQQVHKNTDPTRRVTRSHTAHFPLMRLPVELRINIYRMAMLEPRRIEASKISIPRLLQTTQQLRKESLGLLTTINEIEFTTRSTYNVTDAAPISATHPYFWGTGLLIIDDNRRDWFIEHDVTFKTVRLGVMCVCCVDSVVAYFNIRVKGNRFILDIEEMFVKHPLEFHNFIEFVASEVEIELRWAESRSSYLVGLKYSDLRRIAQSFQV